MNIYRTILKVAISPKITLIFYFHIESGK